MFRSIKVLNFPHYPCISVCFSSVHNCHSSYVLLLSEMLSAAFFIFTSTYSTIYIHVNIRSLLYVFMVNSVMQSDSKSCFKRIFQILNCFFFSFVKSVTLLKYFSSSIFDLFNYLRSKKCCAQIIITRVSPAK